MSKIVSDIIDFVFKRTGFIRRTKKDRRYYDRRRNHEERRDGMNGMSLAQYQDQVVLSTAQKLNRELTSEEVESIRSIYSYMRLEAFEMALGHDTVGRIEEDLKRLVIDMERGVAYQQCFKCKFQCTSSTIFKRQAATYDPRCPKCGTNTMLLTKWVKIEV